jgi:hypothetical protein
LNPTPPKGYNVTDDDIIVPIPEKVIAMLSWEGYIAMFWFFVQEYDYLHKHAWEACERTLEEHRIPQRYESYESFKVMKGRANGETPSEIQVW